jgi:hypothetical protein
MIFSSKKEIMMRRVFSMIAGSLVLLGAEQAHAKIVP